MNKRKRKHKVSETSLANLRRSSRRQGEGKIPKSVALPQDAIEIATEIGGGNLSKGLTLLVREYASRNRLICPTCNKALEAPNE